ncbi:hypothetical protein D3C81_1320990 [compost metagenome]
MADGAAPGGDALALQVRRRVQRRVGIDDQRGAVGVGLVHSDGLDLRAGGQGEQQRRIADDPGIHRTGIQRLRQWCGSGELGPLDIVGQVLQRVGRFQLGAHVALLVGDTQDGTFGGDGLDAAEQHCQRHAEGEQQAFVHFHSLLPAPHGPALRKKEIRSAGAVADCWWGGAPGGFIRRMG